MKNKYLIITLISLTITAIQIYTESRPVDTSKPEPTSASEFIKKITDAQAKQKEAQAAEATAAAALHATQEKTSTNVAQSVTASQMSVHDIIAQANASFGGKLTLPEQSQLASAITQAKTSQDIIKLDNLLATLEAQHQTKGTNFNKTDFLTNLKKNQSGKTIADQITSAFNYIKLQFAHVVKNVKGVSIDTTTLSKPSSDPTTTKASELPTAQQYTAAQTDSFMSTKIKRSFEPTPSMTPKNVQISTDNKTAVLTDATGKAKVTLENSSTQGAIIRSIDSTANPITIAQSISDALAKSGAKPLTSTEVTTLGSYLQQMSVSTLAETTVNKVLPLSPEQSNPSYWANHSDDFNAYLNELLKERNTNLSETQLLDAIKNAENKKISPLETASNATRLALASTPELPQSSSGALTFSSPIVVLPAGVQPISSIKDLATFGTSLKSTLDSMNLSQAQEAIAKLLGSSTDPDALGSALSTLSDTIANDMSYSQIFPEQKIEINAFLQRISSDPVHPIVLSDANFAQVKTELANLVHDTLNPNADYPLGGKPTDTTAEKTYPDSFSQGINDRILKSMLENYPSKIQKILSKKLGTDLNLLAQTSESITVQFESLKDNFIKQGYPTKDAAITNMNTLLATADGKTLTQQELTNRMKILNSFLKNPDSFDSHNKAIINDLLKNMKSDLTLGSINARQISQSLAPFKDILKIALPEAETSSKSLFTKATPVTGSIEAFAPTYIESVLNQKTGRTRIDESLPTLTQETISLKDSCTLFAKGLLDQLPRGKLSQDGVAQVLNSLIRSNKGIYDLSNSDAKKQFLSDIQTLQTFLQSPTSTENSRNNQIINNILRNMKIDLTLTSTNVNAIRDSLKPLDSMLKIASDSLKTQIASPTQVPALPKSKPSDPLLTNAEPANPQELFAKTKLDTILATKTPVSGASPLIAEANSVRDTAKKLAQNPLPQDQATALINELLASAEGRYNLSQSTAKAELINKINLLSSFIDKPTTLQGKDAATIDDLLRNMGSSLTFATASNPEQIRNAVYPLQDLINDALGKPNTRKSTVPAPAPATSTTLANLFGWK